MAAFTGFSGTSAFRRSAIALAAAATLFAANAQAATFSEQECKVVAGISAKTVRAVGPETLSQDFRRSLMSFAAPDGQRATCSGPTNIATPTVNDVAAFNVIRGILASGSNPIDLQARGLRSVASLALNNG